MNQLFLILFTFSMMNPVTLVDFSSGSSLSQWVIINDGVMGGKSQSKIYLNDAGNAVFSGDVSLENYGGFASVRYQFEQIPIAGYENIILYLKGDGKKYQFRVKAELSDRHSYISYFETSGEWQQIEIPLNKMFASFRGQKLNIPDFAAETIAEISVLIGNETAESFALEINKIELK